MKKRSATQSASNVHVCCSNMQRGIYPFTVCDLWFTGRATFEAEMARSGEEAEEIMRQLEALTKRENDRYVGNTTGREGRHSATGYHSCANKS